MWTPSSPHFNLTLEDFRHSLPPRRRPGGAPMCLPFRQRALITLAIFARWGRFSGQRDFYRYAKTSRLLCAKPSPPCPIARSSIGWCAPRAWASSRRSPCTWRSCSTRQAPPPTTRPWTHLSHARWERQAKGRGMAGRGYAHIGWSNTAWAGTRRLSPASRRLPEGCDQRLGLGLRFHLKGPAVGRNLLRRALSGADPGLRSAGSARGGADTTCSTRALRARGQPQKKMARDRYGARDVCPPKRGGRKRRRRRSWPKRSFGAGRRASARSCKPS